MPRDLHMNAQVLAWSRAINRPRVAIALLVFALTLAIRIHGISQHFWLLTDQMRDWAIALRPFSELPLVGPPTPTSMTLTRTGGPARSTGMT
jgi:hypothetical protein